MPWVGLQVSGQQKDILSGCPPPGPAGAEQKQTSINSKAAVVSVEQMAEAGHADLFCGFCEVPGSELEAAIREITERAQRSSAVLEAMLKRPQRHRWWGINE